MDIAAVIPVRMGSSRFPGKPLTPIMGRTMVEHVYKRVALSKTLNSGTYIATPDEEIRKVVEEFGGQVVMTAPTHERASDRVAEAARAIDADIFVMVQGDEPLVTPEMIDLSVQPLIKDKTIFCTNLVKRIGTQEEFEDRNTIKVVMDESGYALYFSREPIPTTNNGDFSTIQAYKQVCIIPYPKQFLLNFSEMKPTSLELAESIDMLRIIQHGQRVMMVECTQETHAVDMIKDVAVVEKLMANDPVMALYN